MNKSKKSVKKQPFDKHAHSRSIAPVVIALLFVFNFAYSYAIGIPFVHIVVDSYVESVYALGDVQERAYMVMGDAVVTGAVALANIPVGFSAGHTNIASVATAAESPQYEHAPPEPLLLVAPNYIR